MTRKISRFVTAEEKALFEESFKQARPLAGTSSTPASHKIPAAKHANDKSCGLDGRAAERLRRGLLKPDGRLDLHGFTEAAAHRALITFLRSAQMRGHRLVIVITGKGGRPPADDAPFDLELDARSRGVLKSMVPRWLAQSPLAGIVATSREAHRKHGGGGALYVYLRKNPRTR